MKRAPLFAVLLLMAYIAGYGQQGKPKASDAAAFKSYGEYETARDQWVDDISAWRALQILKGKATPAGVLAAEVKAQAEEIAKHRETIKSLQNQIAFMDGEILL